MLLRGCCCYLAIKKGNHTGEIEIEAEKTQKDDDWQRRVRRMNEVKSSSIDVELKHGGGWMVIELIVLATCTR